MQKTKKVTNNGRLPIGAYFGPFPKDPRWPDEPDTLNDETFKIAHDGGFNFMIGFAERYPANAEAVARSMECAAHNDMRMILSDANIEQGTIEYKLKRDGRLPDIKAEYQSSIVDHGAHKGYWGVYCVDEPLPDRFPLLATIRDVFYEVSPDHLFFVNMLPTYAIHGMLDVDWIYDNMEREEQYKKYIAGYLDMVRPEVLCYDYYPYLQQFPAFGGDFFVNLAVAREETKRRGLPFWVSPQAGVWGDPNCRGLSIGEMRHQIYMSVAFGATGLVYYVWTASAGHTQGLMKDAKPTYLYNYAKECNLFIGRIENELLNQESLGVIVSGETLGRIPEYAKAKDTGSIAEIVGAHTLTGVFEKENGYNYLIVNNSITEKDEVTVTFRTAKARTAVYPDGREETLDGEKYTLRLDIGDCIFIKE